MDGVHGYVTEILALLIEIKGISYHQTIICLTESVSLQVSSLYNHGSVFEMQGLLDPRSIRLSR